MRLDRCVLVTVLGVAAVSGMSGVVHAQRGPGASAPTGQTQWGPVENEYFRAVKNDLLCAQPGPRCKDRVILALGDVTVKGAGKTRKLKRGEVAMFGAGQSYEMPTGDHFWEIIIQPDHPPVPGPKEVIVPENDIVLGEGDDYWIYNERLAPGQLRPRHSHTMRAVVQLNSGVGAGGGGAITEWPLTPLFPAPWNMAPAPRAATPQAAPAAPAAPPLELTPAQAARIVSSPPRGNDSIAFAGPVIHTNRASQYGPLSGIIVMLKSDDEKAGKAPAAFHYKK